MKICRKPAIAADCVPSAPQSSDDFSTPSVGLQWQFNHNPDTAYYSLSARPGWFEIKPQPADILRNAKNQLTQKLMGYRSEATVTLDFSAMTPGERAGLECIGKQFHGAGIMIGGTPGKPVASLYVEADSSVVFSRPLSASELLDGQRQIFLRLTADTTSDDFHFSYSLDGKSYAPLGEPFAVQPGFWKGIRPGIYAYSVRDAAQPLSSAPTSGRVWFGNFIYRHDGPAGGLE